MVAFGGIRFGRTRQAIDKPSALVLRRRRFTMQEPVIMPTTLQKLPLRYRSDIDIRSTTETFGSVTFKRGGCFAPSSA